MGKKNGSSLGVSRKLLPGVCPRSGLNISDALNHGEVA